MKKNFLIFLFIYPFFLFAQPDSWISDFIKIDQFGYLPNATKIAVISDPVSGFNSDLSFTAGNTYQVRRWSDNAVVFSGTPQIWNSGAEHLQSGDRGWWFDFSAVTTPGVYYIYDTTNDVHSGQFEIDADVYSLVFKSVCRMFYLNRCNAEKAIPYTHSHWTDNTSFTQDQNARYVFDQQNSGMEKDLSGGWFDAGDYNKYTTYTDGTLHDLLWAYEDNPTVFSDDWDIPESGNGIPDVLDEVKWELDWLFKMNNADGSTHNKVGSLDYETNSLSPPSLNTSTRYYGPTCTSASISVAGSFAHASYIFGTIPGMNSYAQELKNRAIASWNYVLPFINNNQLETDCDNIEIVSGDADWSVSEQMDKAIKAAVYLFDITGDNAYSQFVVDNYPDTEQFQGGWWSVYERHLNDALLLYSTLPGADAATSADIRSKLTSAVNVNYESTYGQNDIDLYRAHMADFAYHSGSNMIKAGFGLLNLSALKFGIVPANANSYAEQTSGILHYFHGVNPMGITYLSNMNRLGAERSVMEITHTWFYDDTPWDNAITSIYGPPPGFVPGGANGFYDFEPSPPAGEPTQKGFLDFNNQAYLASIITEPAIYYQAAYLRLLAESAGQSPNCPPPGSSCNDGNPNTINDMADGLCNCFGTTQPDNCELIHNGSLDFNIDGWENWGSSPYRENGTIQITNILVGANPYDAAMYQWDLTLEQGTEYTLQFDASAASNRSINVKVGGGAGVVYEAFNLTNTMQSYSHTFTMTQPTTTQGELEFHVGISAADVTLDNISMTPTDCMQSCPTALQLPDVLSSGTRQASNSVSSDATIPKNLSVLFRAGQTIILDNGFTTGSETDFGAEIGGCQ